MAGSKVVLVVAVLFLAAAPVRSALTVQQVTSTPTNEKGPFRRNSSTSGGQVLFVDSGDTVRLFNGTSVVPLQTLPNAGEEVNDGVFMLGSHSVAGQVIGAWRRGNGYGVVSVNAGAPVTTLQNPEAVSVGEGCVFMILLVARLVYTARRHDRPTP